MKYLVTLTDDEVYGGTPRLADADEIKEHLKSGEIKSVIFFGTREEDGDCVFDKPVVISHTADPVYYYLALYPCKEPDDVIDEHENDLDDLLRQADIQGSL